MLLISVKSVDFIHKVKIIAPSSEIVFSFFAGALPTTVIGSTSPFGNLYTNPHFDSR